MRVLIGQKPIDYCASKLIENRARETVTVNKVQFSYITSHCIALHARGQTEFHNSSLASYCKV